MQELKFKYDGVRLSLLTDETGKAVVVLGCLKRRCEEEWDKTKTALKSAMHFFALATSRVPRFANPQQFVAWMYRHGKLSKKQRRTFMLAAA